MKKIFITGATGFLGRYLLKRLLDDKTTFAFILARGKRGASADERVVDMLKYFYDDRERTNISKRIRVVEGEVDRRNFGMSDSAYNLLVKEIDEIYHSAAIAEFRVPLNRIRKINVGGTENVLDFAMRCKNDGRLKKVNHISTTFVAGTKEGILYENDHDLKQKFNNTYEQSKFEAERIAFNYMAKGLGITIFRPSILTGDLEYGKTSNFKMLYQPLHFLAEELFDCIPADGHTKLNLIPVDVVSKMIYLIAQEDETVNKTYHIANKTTIELEHFIDAAVDFFGFKKPELIPVEHFDMRKLTHVQMDLIRPYIPYFNYKIEFDTTNSRAVLKKKRFVCPPVDDDALVKIFKFCAGSGFIKPKKHYLAV